MPSILEDSSQHTVTIHGVQFEVSPNVIVELLKLTCALETSVKAKHTHDVGTSSSSTGPIDPYAKGDDEDDGNQSRDVHHDEDCFVLTRRHHMNFETKNTFIQKDLFYFFHMLRLIVATNLDPIAHKAMFNRTIHNSTRS